MPQRIRPHASLRRVASDARQLRLTETRHWTQGQDVEAALVEDPMAPVIERHVLERQFDRALALFGNATPPVLDWLVHAWPFVPGDQRAECLRQLWMHGRTGLFDGERLQELLLLLRQTPALRETIPQRSTFTLYRGVAGGSEADARLKMHRPAWTESRRMAVFFAARWHHPASVPYLGEVTVPRSEVVAYFDEREESEIVLDPTLLDDRAIRVIRVPLVEAEDVLAWRERESRARLEARKTPKAAKG